MHSNSTRRTLESARHLEPHGATPSLSSWRIHRTRCQFLLCYICCCSNPCSPTSSCSSRKQATTAINTPARHGTKSDSCRIHCETVWTQNGRGNGSSGVAGAELAEPESEAKLRTSLFPHFARLAGGSGGRSRLGTDFIWLRGRLYPNPDRERGRGGQMRVGTLQQYDSQSTASGNSVLIMDRPWALWK